MERTDSCLIEIAPGQGIILFEHDDHEIAIAPYSRQIGPYAVLEELGRQPYVLHPLNDCRGAGGLRAPQQGQAHHASQDWQTELLEGHGSAP